ncbi:MAG: STAS domain-containing protein [Opitutales bacterium]|jgi:anti-anti-sigma factor
MEIDRQTASGIATLVVRGRLDAAWSAPLGESLQQTLRDGFHQVHLDLSGVTFLSSGGIRVLLSHWKELRRVQGRFAIVSLTPDVERTLRLAGLAALLDPAPEPPAPPAPSAFVSSPKPWHGPGFAGEIESLIPGARLRGSFLGCAPSAVAPDLTALASTPLEHVSLPAGTVAVGFGAFGSAGNDQPLLGELLAVGGAAACLPADGANQPDFLVTENQLAPEAVFAQGLVAEGPFASLARFEIATNARSAALSDLLAALLASANGPHAAFAAVLESTALVGAHLRRAPGDSGAGQAFDFPAVRDWLTFTAEPAYPNTVALLAGVVTSSTDGPLARFTRPLGVNHALRAHVHAAVFPYRPVRHGHLELPETVASLFESGNIAGVLHLLSDHRTAGAGESRFYRGALWFGPLDV